VSAQLRLRPMGWRDIPAAAALERASFPEDAWSEATWWAELAGRPRRHYTVAQDETDALAGYAGVDLAGEVADVMTIAVDPSRRGAGLGPRLLRHLLERATTSGARQVLLEVRADNPAAIAMYERHRFEVVHTRRGYYRPSGVDALVMRREVCPGG